MTKNEVQVLLITSEDNQFLVDVSRMARKAQAKVSSYSHQQWLEYLKTAQPSTPASSSTFGQRPNSPAMLPQLSPGAQKLAPQVPPEQVTKKQAFKLDPPKATPTNKIKNSTPANWPQNKSTTPQPTVPQRTEASPTAAACPLVNSAAKPSYRGELISFSKTNTIEDLQKQAIQSALAKCRGNMTQTARQLGIGRATLYRKIKIYGLDTVHNRVEIKKMAA